MYIVAWYDVAGTQFPPVGGCFPVSQVCEATTCASVHAFSKHYALIHAFSVDVIFGNAIMSSILDSIPKFLPPCWDTTRESPDAENP